MFFPENEIVDLPNYFIGLITSTKWFSSMINYNRIFFSIRVDLINSHINRYSFKKRQNF